MSNAKSSKFHLFFILLLGAQLMILQGVHGNIPEMPLPNYHEDSHQSLSSQTQSILQGEGRGWRGKMRSMNRRMMIGSVAPTCTYNECRNCKYKCRAEQVPVEGNDPINSPYHYKCICHR